MTGGQAIYPVLCSGHSGSRLLVRLMMANGIFMGAQRSKVGEDENVFGEMLWNTAFQRTYTVLRKYPDDPRNRDALKTILSRAHSRFLKGLDQLTAMPAAVGFKDATLFPYVAADYRALLDEHGIRTRFIHLVRHPLHWMMSGRDPVSRGIQRPSRHLNFSRLSDPFIRLVWFDSLGDEVEYDGRSIRLADTEIYSEEDQILLEAMMWRTTNRISAELSDRPEDYLLLSYEELILHPQRTLQRVSEFMGVPVAVPADLPIRKDRLRRDPRESLSDRAVETTLDICGDLMAQLGLPQAPPVFAETHVSPELPR